MGASRPKRAIPHFRMIPRLLIKQLTRECATAPIRRSRLRSHRHPGAPPC